MDALYRSYYKRTLFSYFSKWFKNIIIGENPLDIDYLWSKMYENTLYYGRSGSVIQAMAGIDIALWDLKGKF